jgi:hypothetical protein
MERTLMPSINVDEEIPYVVDKNEEIRLRSLQNHVTRRNPDVKLKLDTQKNDMQNLGREEASYPANQRIFDRNHPYKYCV